MKPTDFSMLLTAFLSEYLPLQKNVSRNTIMSYRDTFKLLLFYCESEVAIPAERLIMKKLSADLIENFLIWLETERNCSISTRNLRLTAIHSFFRYAQAETPEQLYYYQKILAIPLKKKQKVIVEHLSAEGIKILLQQPDKSTSQGRRDLTLLSLMYDSGARVQEIIDLSARDVSDTIQRGGTFLQTARCKAMRSEEGQQKAAAICKKYGIDGLVVIGGDGSFAGAQKLANLGVNTIGIPGTIDLDIACTDYTIGFDTAVNTAMEAIDKVRDTSTSHERCSIIEVMGRDAGYLALWCGIANGAERILMPEEHDYDEQEIISDIMENKKRGKKNYIIINAEGIGDSINMAKRIEAATGIETRATILGHMQRGGSPTCKDRVYASIMGSMAVDLLCQGKTNRVVGYKNGEYVDYDIEEALAMKKSISNYQCTVAKTLAL